MRPHVIPALALVAFALPDAGHAAHPYVTDDAGTQGAGGWQLELVAEHAHLDREVDLAGTTTRTRRSATLVNPVLTYGLLENLDLAIGFSHLGLRTVGDAGSTRERGASDSTVELKWRFLEGGGFALALKPGLVLPTGNENRGLGTGEVSWAANLIAGGDATPWSWMANVAYLHARYRLRSDTEASRGSLWRASAGFGYAAHARLRFVAELGVRTNSPRDDAAQPGRTAAFATMGAIWSPSEWLDLDLGVRLGNRAEADAVALAGLTLRW